MRYEVKGGCVFCGTCGMVCPVNAVEVVDGKTRIDPDVCIRCGKCLENCYTQAIVKTEDEDQERSED